MIKSKLSETLSCIVVRILREIKPNARGSSGGQTVTLPATMRNVHCDCRQSVSVFAWYVEHALGGTRSASLEFYSCSEC